MGVKDKLDKLFGLYDGDEDEKPNDSDKNGKKDEKKSTEVNRSAQISDIKKSFDSRPMTNTQGRTSFPEAPKIEASRISSSTGRYTNPINMVVTEPSGFEECPRLVDSLKAKKPVIINLENLETDAARKIFDFLSGATYALNGNVQKVANNIFLFAPANVDINYNSGQKTDISKNNWSK